jgi:hypothetical protein
MGCSLTRGRKTPKSDKMVVDDEEDEPETGKSIGNKRKKVAVVKEEVAKEKKEKAAEKERRIKKEAAEKEKEKNAKEEERSKKGKAKEVKQGKRKADAEEEEEEEEERKGKGKEIEKWTAGKSSEVKTKSATDSSSGYLSNRAYVQIKVQSNVEKTLIGILKDVQVIKEAAKDIAEMKEAFKEIQGLKDAVKSLTHKVHANSLAQEAHWRAASGSGTSVRSNATGWSDISGYSSGRRKAPIGSPALHLNVSRLSSTGGSPSNISPINLGDPTAVPLEDLARIHLEERTQQVNVAMSAALPFAPGPESTTTSVEKLLVEQPGTSLQAQTIPTIAPVAPPSFPAAPPGAQASARPATPPLALISATPSPALISSSHPALYTPANPVHPATYPASRVAQPAHQAEFLMPPPPTLGLVEPAPTSSFDMPTAPFLAGDDTAAGDMDVSS